MIFDYVYAQGMYFLFGLDDDFKLWTKNWPPEANAMAYFTMVEERTHATRLEF